MITIERTFRQSAGFIQIDPLQGYIFSPESYAHKFVIHRDESSFTQSAEVELRFLKADQVTEYVEGSVESGDAVVTLSPECYQCPGRFIMSILVTESGSKTCIYAASSSVMAGDSTNVHVANGTTRMIDELIDDLEDTAADAQQAVAAAQAAVNGIENQRDTIIAAIASIAGQGTDSTLTQSGVAADAKAVGDLIYSYSDDGNGNITIS